MSVSAAEAQLIAGVPQPRGAERARTAVRRARHMRKIGALAGLLLASCYFMPALNCLDDGPHVNPSVELRKTFRRDTRRGVSPWQWQTESTKWVAEVLVYAAPYIFGALAGAGALVRLWGNPPAQRRWAFYLLGFLLAIAAGTVFCAINGHTMWGDEIVFALGPRKGVLIFCVIVPILGSLYALWWMRLRERALLGLTCLGSMLCLMWWFRWFFNGVPFLMADYGLIFAGGATLVLLITVVAETALLSMRPPGATILALALGRIGPQLRDDERCVFCGYCLHGSASQRCPECGNTAP